MDWKAALDRPVIVAGFDRKDPMRLNPNESDMAKMQSKYAKPLRQLDDIRFIPFVVHV